jgi:nucleoside-diphosphate-sugar epimerase
VYNIAADGVVSVSDVAEALGGRPVRVPRPAATAASALMARVPFVPSAVEWLHAVRTPMVMDTRKAKTQLGWTPTHTSAETLKALAEAV